eukprot:5173301-Prymnesium_polylepis.1
MASLRRARKQPETLGAHTATQLPHSMFCCHLKGARGRADPDFTLYDFVPVVGNCTVRVQADFRHIFHKILQGGA